MYAAWSFRKRLVIQLLRVVLVPLRNFDDDVGRAVRHGLAAEARFRRDAWRFVELVELRIRRFVAGFEAFAHDDMARGARADTAACMVEAGLQRFGEIQDASRKAIVPVRNLRR